MLIYIIGIVVAIFVFVGIPYVWSSCRQKRSCNIENRRDYVIANLEKFKVNNEGTSLDEKEIYLVSHKRLGL